MHCAAVPFHQPWQCAQLCGAKTILLSQIGMSWIFSSSNFTVQDHILSTGGDALRTSEFDAWSSSQQPGTSTCTYMMARVNQQPPPAHHPLEAYYDSVVDEPQLSGHCIFPLENLSCKEGVM